MRRAFMFTVLLFTGIFVPRAEAGVQFLLPDDPQADEIRRPAIEFVSKIAEGDLVGAERDLPDRLNRPNCYASMSSSSRR